MRIGGELGLRVVTDVLNHGAPALELETLKVESSAVLDRDDVEQLRDACQTFLDGDPLPR